MTELTRKSITELLQLEILARETGFTVIVDVDEEENPEYYVTFSSDPNSFSKVFNRIAEAATSMVNFTEYHGLLKKSRPTLADFLDVLHESVELSTANELKDAVKLIIEVQDMDSGMRDCIRAAFLNGPLDDGDVPSKSGRDALLENDYISKVVVKGEEGFNALTYKGARAYRLIKAGA